MNKQDFLKAGYREYDVDIANRNWADILLQKRFDDEKGKMYFINVYFNIPMPYHNFKSEPSAKAQFEVPEGTVNIDLFIFKSIKGMEQFYATAWKDMQADYYEKKGE